MKYESKLDNSIKINFRLEKKHNDLLEDYCDNKGLNKSAVLRRIIIEFLRTNKVLE